MPVAKASTEGAGGRLSRLITAGTVDRLSTFASDDDGDQMIVVLAGAEVCNILQVSHLVRSHCRESILFFSSLMLRAQ